MRRRLGAAVTHVKLYHSRNPWQLCDVSLYLTPPKTLFQASLLTMEEPEEGSGQCRVTRSTEVEARPNG